MGTFCGGLSAQMQALLATQCRYNADCTEVAECCGAPSYVVTIAAQYFSSLKQDSFYMCQNEAHTCSSTLANLPAACLDGKCQACLQTNAACTDGAQCCSLACTNGRCACGISGAPCNAGGDCCSGVCGAPSTAGADRCKAYCS
jgi:hypothetical protein